jgi:hypothetical protein
MDKRKILVILLFVLPLLVVLIANGAKGVMMFDGEEVTYYPWIQPLSESAVGWCAPVAALMNYVLFALAVVYGLKKKEWSVKGIRNIALIAGTLAVLPNLIRSDVMVVPNVFGAITLFADALVAHILGKDLAKGEKTDAPRKTRHL